MLDAVEELERIGAGLYAAEIPFVLCGELALMAYGIETHASTIDLLIEEADLERVWELVEPLGFNFHALLMSFAGGQMQIRRVTKFDDDQDQEPLSLDLMLKTPSMQIGWDAAITVDWEGRKLRVISEAGLKELERLWDAGRNTVDMRLVAADREDPPWLKRQQEDNAEAADEQDNAEPEEPEASAAPAGEQDNAEPEEGAEAADEQDNAEPEEPEASGEPAGEQANAEPEEPKASGEPAGEQDSAD